jgi:hypothetical protein
LHRLSASQRVTGRKISTNILDWKEEMAFAWNAAQAFHSVRGKTRFPSETLEKLGEVS